ncbi:MAG: precorrin-6y C5,15-methyltransferase (decarboxylating) subunit CbiE [Desulfurivibrio sp.]|nr:precorrin-6y C5,15-methyltransferase (decarboxylating) subunit CbiE [Desulfurivibrio sp.]
MNDPTSTGKIVVAGLGPEGLGATQRQTLAACCCLLSAERHRPLAASLAGDNGPAIRPLTPLPAALAEIAARLPGGDVGVLVGGDPLFFGLGRRLLAHFAPEQLEFQPALSSLQLACARFRLPWDDARLVSLHGRRESHGASPRIAGARLASRLLSAPKSVVLTDQRHSPSHIATALGQYLSMIGAEATAAAVRIMVGENLGSADERLFSGDLAATAGGDFGPLNVMIILNPMAGGDPAGGEPVPLGLRESDFVHQRGMITKDEVRAVTLHKLALPAGGVLWDIGAASGSISLEAVRLAPGLLACAIEQEESRLADLKANIVRLGAFAVLPVAGVAPAVLSELPDPERIFIGGSGGRLAAIIAAGAERLATGGRLVVNGVTAATREQAPPLLEAAGLRVEISEVAIRRRNTAGRDDNFNPITIITGSR